MKRAQSILLCAAGVLTLVACALILVSSQISDPNADSNFFWPIFSNSNPPSSNYNNGFIFEKIVQQNESSEDMRSPIYLTQQRILLENIGKLQINYHQKSYILNDICYKPHSAIFLQFKSGDSIPHHFQRLLLEIERLSPCLLVTPLNCFLDSYGIHSEISRWYDDTDFLNRRLRNAFIEAQGENEIRPYVISKYGPELIRKWSDLMFKLKSDKYPDFREEDLQERVKMWLNSIEPRHQLCSNPIHSCNETMSAEKYLNMCTEIQQLNSSNLIKYQLKNEDISFISQLDCVDDQDEFIEWMQKREIGEIIKEISSTTKTSYYEENINQECDGIYHDANSSGIPFFKGTKSFFSEDNPFDSMKLEIALMTPAMLLKKLINADYVNGFESIWTVQKAEELLDEFRMALREEVYKFNEKQISRKLRVTTDIVSTGITENEEDSSNLSPNSIILLLVGCRGILVLLFFSVVWLGNRLRSIGMFLIRDIFTASLFIFLCKTDGIITLDYTALSYGLILTFVNLFLTTRVSFCAHRLERCIQRTKHYAINSNFSSLGTVPVDSVKEFSDTRQIQYILAKYTKYQAAQDAYSRQPFENLSKFGYVLSVLFVPVVIAYWYFVDQNCQKILIVILPSLIIAALEEGWEKRKLTKERKMIQTLREQLNETTKEFLSREDTENVFSGNQIDERNFGKSYAASDSNIREESSKNLFKLSNSTYDVNQYMRYPNQLTRSLRFYAIAGYFHVIKLRKMSCLGWAIPLLLICIASGVLFIPIERESIEINANQNDLFIDFSIYNVSSNFNLLMDELKKFDKHFESIENLQTISNLYQSFQSFNQNESDQQGVEMYSKWIREEPINWAILTQRMESSSRSLIPNPFKFQFQYKFEKLNEYSIRETVQQIDNLLPKYSELLSPKASGVLYEHYHQMDVVWKRFAIHEILASSIVFSFISLIHFIFSITPNFKLNIIFSTFVIGTRLEFAAVFSLLSLEYHPLYANFAVLIGFLAAWTPYCDLARFRRRILYRAAVERLSPEIRESRRRIRVPFIAAADVLQFFGTILSVSTTVAVLSAIVPTFKIFLLPTVIFIGIQLCALMNSVAILLSTKQMFEQEVRHFLHHDLRGGNTSANICDLTRKKLLEKCKEDILIEMDQLNIRPIPDEPLFFSPPPKKQSTEKKVLDSDRNESDEKDDEPSTSRSHHPMVDEIMKSIDIREEDKEKILQNFHPFNLEGRGVFSDPVHFLTCGAPIDGSYRLPLDQATEVEHLEIDYKIEEELYDDDQLCNSGDNMEEILRTGSERKRRAPEENSNDPNAPGSSNRFRPSTFFVPRVPPIVSPSGVPQAPGSSSPGLMPDVIAPETRPIPRQVDNLFMNEHLPHIDLVRYPNESPPEYDPNWVSPPGTPPIAAYADALAFHRSRNIRDNRDENDSNQNPDV